MPSRDDERLVMRCQLGEPGAIDAFVVRWHGDLRRYVRSWLTSDDEAGDVLQNVWLNVLRGLPGLRNPAAVAPWLFRIARATVMSRLRHRYTEPATTDDGPEPPLVTDDPLLRLDLERSLDQLGVVERETLLLFHVQGLSLTETAEVLRVPVGTVKSRLHRARGQLRLLLEGHHP